MACSVMVDLQRRASIGQTREEAAALHGPIVEFGFMNQHGTLEHRNRAPWTCRVVNNDRPRERRTRRETRRELQRDAPAVAGSKDGDPTPIHRWQRLEIALRTDGIEEALSREFRVPLEHVRPSAGAVAVCDQRREPGSEQTVLVFTQLPVSRDPTGGVQENHRGMRSIVWRFAKLRRDREGGRWCSRELDIRGEPHSAAYERGDRDECEIELPLGSRQITGLTCHSNSSAIVRFIKRFDGTAAGSRALRATSTPATGSPVGSNRPNCTRTDAWSQ